MYSTLDLLSKAGVALNLKKCFIFEVCIEYFGHVIQQSRLDILTKAAYTIYELQNPTNVTKLHTFVGDCNLYPKPVPIFSSIAALLICQLGKSRFLIRTTEWDWTPSDHHYSIDCRQQRYWHYQYWTDVIRLTFTHGTRRLGLLAAGEAWMTGKAPGYASRSLHRAEQAYNATRKEFLLTY